MVKDPHYDFVEPLNFGPSAARFIEAQREDKRRKEEEIARLKNENRKLDDQDVRQLDHFSRQHSQAIAVTVLQFMRGLSCDDAALADEREARSLWQILKRQPAVRGSIRRADYRLNSQTKWELAIVSSSSYLRVDAKYHLSDLAPPASRRFLQGHIKVKTTPPGTPGRWEDAFALWEHQQLKGEPSEEELFRQVVLEQALIMSHRIHQLTGTSIHMKIDFAFKKEWAEQFIRRHQLTNVMPKTNWSDETPKDALSSIWRGSVIFGD